MKMKMKMKNKVQHGFTLIELMVVLIILSVVGAIGAQKIFGYTESAKAQAVYEITNQLNDEVRSLGSTHGVGPSIATTTLLLAGNSYLDVLRFGDDYVNTTYQTKYKYMPHTNIEGLSVLTSPSAGAAGTYTIEGMPITTAANSSGTANVYTLTQVEPAIIANYLTEYAPEETFVEGAAGGTADKVQWTYSAGQYTLNITYPF